MKRLGLVLLAVLMVAGCGGGGGDDDFAPTLSNMAGVYNLTKMTGTKDGVKVEAVPPTISGTINLTSAGTYSIDITLEGDRTTGTGTWAISDDTIIIDGGELSGPITDDGRKLSVTGTGDGMTVTLEFTRS